MEKSAVSNFKFPIKVACDCSKHFHWFLILLLVLTNRMLYNKFLGLFCQLSDYVMYCISTFRHHFEHHLMPGYSWNIAKVGVKHQWINKSINEHHLCWKKQVYLLPKWRYYLHNSCSHVNETNHKTAKWNWESLFP
jgi:hypothetical protein